MTREKVGTWLFGAVSILCVISALIPVLKGDSPNVVLLASGVVFFVLALAARAKGTRTDDSAPPSAQ